MDLILVNAALLFSLSIPVVMKYRILPIYGTPYWLFGMLFFLLVGNVILSVFFQKLRWVRVSILWIVLTIVVGGVVVTQIVDRSKTAPIYGVHDIILQQEAAMRFLIEGKNPYKETYFNTPLADWHYDELGKPAVNPALYHFVMPPWYLVFPFSFYMISIPVLGYFDGRMPLIAMLFALCYILAKWFQRKDIGITAIILTALSPAVIDYFIEGRSDLFALFWFIWALFLIDRKHFRLSALIFSLAILSKQTIWFAVPFYGIYFWLKTQHSHRERFFGLLLFLVPSALLVIPFLAWDAKAFLDSVVFYLSGNAANSYPVSGYGWSMVLYSAGIIRDLHAYYPFFLWEAGAGLTVLLITAYKLLKRPVMSNVLLFYGLTLFAVWYTSRYFNNSHISYLSSVFAIGLLKRIDETSA